MTRETFNKQIQKVKDHTENRSVIAFINEEFIWRNRIEKKVIRLRLRLIIIQSKTERRIFNENLH